MSALHGMSQAVMLQYYRKGGMKMASAGFTRDEVILALDVLYSSEKQRVSADSEAMIDLSALLNRLPIHPPENRRTDFRSTTGVSTQLHRFRRSLISGKNNDSIGLLFFQILLEFEGRFDELHSIADAIRKNEPSFSAEFGSRTEDSGFPEGILLGHLHRLIEIRDGAKAPIGDHCEICSLKPELYYQPCGELLQQHLLVSPIEMDGKKRYAANCFIMVCPNCHAALHCLRPWHTRDNCGDILR